MNVADTAGVRESQLYAAIHAVAQAFATVLLARFDATLSRVEHTSDPTRCASKLPIASFPYNQSKVGPRAVIAAHAGYNAAILRNAS
jgi:hypothetical protein